MLDTSIDHAPYFIGSMGDLIILKNQYGTFIMLLYVVCLKLSQSWHVPLKNEHEIILNVNNKPHHDQW
jgi:hypothetical protein